MKSFGDDTLRESEDHRLNAEYGVSSFDSADGEVEIVFKEQAVPASMAFTAVSALSSINSQDVYSCFINLPANAKKVAIEVYDLAIKAYPEMKAKFDEFSVHVKAALDPATLKEKAKDFLLKAESFFTELAVKAKEKATPAAEAFSKKFNEFVSSVSEAYKTFVEKAQKNPTVIKAGERIAEVIETVRQSKAFDQAMTAVASVAGKVQQTAEDFKPKRTDSGQVKSL